MKNAWAALDDRLREQEALSGEIIREMIRGRSKKSLGRLMTVDGLSLIWCILFIPLTLILFESIINFVTARNITPHIILPMKILEILLVVLLVLSTIWYFIKCRNLKKMDMAGNVTENTRLINSYNLKIGYEKAAGYPIIAVLFLYCIYMYVIMRANIYTWIFMLCSMTIAILVVVYFYKRFYKNNIVSIRESLEELKKLNEE